MGAGLRLRVALGAGGRACAFGCAETSFDCGAAFASTDEKDEEGGEEEDDEQCADDAAWERCE
jgi:hypothetical protein